MTQVNGLVSDFLSAYKKTTPEKIQYLDKFLIFSVATALFQGIYSLITGFYPYNSFLACFIQCVGFFIFTSCLRLQLLNPKEFGNISGEQSIAAYIVCNILLLFVVATYIN